MELDRTERRVLGSLMEKRWTTPDQYPLSLNALVAACNQKSNRDPVMQIEEFLVSGCLMGLREKGLVLIREREGGRVPRYAERLTEELSVEPRASAILAELMLRGPQTAPELNRRASRMVEFGSPAEVEETLSMLTEGHLARLLPRQPGQRHQRWTHLLAPENEAAEHEAPEHEAVEEPEAAEETAAPEESAPAAPAPASAPPPPIHPSAPSRPSVPSAPAPPPSAHAPAPVPPLTDIEEEILALRTELARLRERVERLEERLPPAPAP